MIDWLTGLDARVQAALISAIVGLIAGLFGTYLKHLLDRSSVRYRLATEYEYEQRKALRDLIGRHHGRMLDAAERLNHRLWNLQENQDQGWLDMEGNYDIASQNYYYATTLHRLITFLAHIRLFEGSAIFIDSRIAKKNEVVFVKYLKALEWVLTDVQLFDGLTYDSSYSTDHFFRGQLSTICDRCISEEEVCSLAEFNKLLNDKTCSDIFNPILRFCDGLRANENRYRWDRLVAFHLFLMSFINVFGYDMQKTSKAQLNEIARTIKNKHVIENLLRWIPKLGLSKQKEAKRLVSVLKNTL